jgi:hypothetical protein
VSRSRRLVVANVVLIGVAVAAIASIASSVRVDRATRAARGGATAALSAPTSPPEARTLTAPAQYAVIPARNLFSPARTEVTPVSEPPPSSAPPPAPTLLGVVLRDGIAIAYLQDPMTKRVASYRAGDTIAGGTLQRISAEHVVIGGRDGPIEVRLNDSSRRASAVMLPTGGGREPDASVTPPTPVVPVPRQRLRSPFPPPLKRTVSGSLGETLPR